MKRSGDEIRPGDREVNGKGKMFHCSETGETQNGDYSICFS